MSAVKHSELSMASGFDGVVLSGGLTDQWCACGGTGQCWVVVMKGQETGTRGRRGKGTSGPLLLPRFDCSEVLFTNAFQEMRCLTLVRYLWCCLRDRTIRSSLLVSWQCTDILRKHGDTCHPSSLRTSCLAQSKHGMHGRCFL